MAPRGVDRMVTKLHYFRAMTQEWSLHHKGTTTNDTFPRSTPILGHVETYEMRYSVGNHTVVSKIAENDKPSSYSVCFRGERPVGADSYCAAQL